MIDAALPLQVQPPQITSALSLLNQRGQLQQQQANIADTQQQTQQRGLQNQSDSIKLGQQQQGVQDQADSRAATAAAIDPTTGKVDRGVLLSTLAKLNPTVAAQTAQTLQAQDTAAQEAQTKSQAAQLALAEAHVNAKDKLLSGVNDQITYTNAVNSGIQAGIVKPGELPAQYDPQLVAQLHAQTLTQQQQITNMQAAQKEKDAAAQAAATLANTSAHQKVEEQQGNARLGIEGGRLSLERQKFNLENGTGTDASGNNLVDAIGTGHIAPDRLGYLLSKNPALLQGVVAKYPDFDSSKAAAYPATYKDFTSGKTSQVLNAGSTALGHLQELQQLNTVTSRIPGTADHQKYENKVDTLATELAKFYGDSTVSGIANIKSTLNSTFNRDAAIQTQAQSMGDKLDAFQQQWENAAPSKSYQAPMPGLSQKAIDARAAIQNGGSAPKASFQQTATGPGGHKIGSNDGGKTWVDTQTGKPVN